MVDTGATESHQADYDRGYAAALAGVQAALRERQETLRDLIVQDVLDMYWLCDSDASAHDRQAARDEAMGRLLGYAGQLRDVYNTQSSLQYMERHGKDKGAVLEDIIQRTQRKAAQEDEGDEL